MIPGLPEDVFLCGAGLKLCCGQEGSRSVQRERAAGKKTAAGNSAKQGSAKHKGDSPLEERWSFGAFTAGAPKAVRSLAQGVQSYIHNCDTYIAAPFR